MTYSNIMIVNTILIIYTIIVSVPICDADKCGCKTMRPCYKNMLEDLLDRDEVSCIEDAAIGLSTITVFMNALQTYCPFVFYFQAKTVTHGGKDVYQVHIDHVRPLDNKPHPEREKYFDLPVFIIEAGQEGGTESVMLALYVIEQLVACEENDHMMDNVRWVILPCTNPDGLEFSRFSRLPYKKNLKPADGDPSFGVDLTRNFDISWNECSPEWGTSPTYPGPFPESENETIFISNVLKKHKKYAKIYLSIKGDGHSINYPYAYTNIKPDNDTLISRIAGEVAAKVNQRTGGVQLFSNSSIFEAEGTAHCGHSVDYAYRLGITLSFEMRVFLNSDNHILSKFQTLPRGYENSLRNGYFNGIKELYSVLTNKKKYGIVK